MGLLFAQDDIKQYYGPDKDFNKKINIAYYQGGDYFNYPVLFKQVIKNLAELGWLNPIDLSEAKTAKEIWTKLQNEAKSDYLVFKKDAFYNNNWDKKKRKVTADEFIKRLNTQKDIDMIFALGTWAGQDLANNKHSIPTFVMSVSNPVSAGILQSPTSSKYSHIHARVDEKRYIRQIQLFHQIINFKKLGIVYEDTIQGRSYASVDEINNLSDSLNFKVKSCIISSHKDKAKQSLIECYKLLAQSTDAIYITTHTSYKAEDLESFIFDINAKKVPTFSQVGQSHVKYGALLSISRANFRFLGEFHAKVIANSFNGAVPASQEFIFEEPVKLAINVQTSKMIEWDVPLMVLGIADDIYKEIQTKESMGNEIK